MIGDPESTGQRSTPRNILKQRSNMDSGVHIMVGRLVGVERQCHGGETARWHPSVKGTVDEDKEPSSTFPCSLATFELASTTNVDSCSHQESITRHGAHP